MTIAVALGVAVVVVVPPFLARPFEIASLAGAFDGAGSMAELFGDGWDAGFRAPSPTEGSSPPGLPPERLAYRSGALVTDLVVAARVGDRDAVARQARRLEDLLAAGGYAELVPLCSEVASDALDPDVGAPQLAGRVAEAAAQMADTRAGVELLFLEAGEFAQATELAARARDGRLFEEGSYRRLLAKLRRRELGPEVAALLAGLAAELEAESPDWRTVAERAAALDPLLGG